MASDPVHRFVTSLWDTRNPIRKHCLTILRGKRNRNEIMQEISYILLKNYTRTLRTIEDGDTNIELYTYKIANDFRKWKISIDKPPKWANNLDKEIPDLDLYQYRDEPDLFAECMILLLEEGVQELDRDIFFKYWKEEHSEIFIAFKMEIALSYVLRSIRMTLKIIRRHLNPNWKSNSISGQWKTDKKRTFPKPTEESIQKQRESMMALPRLECPKCGRKLIAGKFREWGHGTNCVMTPIDPNYVPNPKKSEAQKGKKKSTGTCPKCGKTMSKSNLSRFHGISGEKCKNK